MKVLPRVLIAVVVLVVGVPVVLGAGLAIWMHFAWAPPDVNKQVKSAELRREHAAAVTRSDQAVATFGSTAPHATKLATAVRDRCDVESAALAAKPTTHCRREVTVYLGLDGDQAGLQRTWTRSLAAAGWKERAPVTKPAAIQQYANDDRRNAEVRLEWRAKATPDIPFGDFQKGIRDIDYDGQVTLEEQPVDLAEVYQDGFARHRYVVALSTIDQYYPARPQPSPTTVSPHQVCFSGQGDCPGG
jgi:hypothetical protein